MIHHTATCSRILRPAAAAACALLLAPAGDASGRPGPSPQASGVVELRYYVLKSGGDKTTVTENPEAALAAGDQIAIRVEPNLDGHLYVFFHAEGGSPAMIYPNVERAASDVKGATAIEVPSSEALKSQWWEVRDGPGIDRLYLVLSREPLEGVPVGEALVKHCATIRGRCYWKPAAPLWERIVREARAGVLSPEVPDAAKPARGTRTRPAVERRPPLRLVADAGAPMAVAVVEVKIKGTPQ